MSYVVAQRPQSRVDPSTDHAPHVEGVVEKVGGVEKDETVGGDLGHVEDGGVDGAAGAFDLNVTGGGYVVDVVKDVVQGVEADIEALGAAAGGVAVSIPYLVGCAGNGEATGVDGHNAGAARGGRLLPKLGHS